MLFLFPYMSTWAAVVLAAGRGKRMHSQTPKLLHPMAGKAMVSHVVDTVRRLPWERVVVVVPPGTNDIRDTLDEGVEYVEQPVPQGTGDALLRTASVLEGEVDHLLVLGGDCPLITQETLVALRARHESTSSKTTILTSTLCPPGDMGRVARGAIGEVTAIIEESEASNGEQTLREVNAGVYCFDASWLWPRFLELRPRPSGEVYLTDLVTVAHTQGATITTLESQEPLEVLGVNNRLQLAQAQKALQQRIRERWMLEGVTLLHPDTTFIDAQVELGQDTVVYPNTGIFGKTKVGRECRLGPNTTITDCSIGDECRIESSTLEDARLEEKVHVGPYSHLRSGTHIEGNVHIGTSAEVKASHLGRGTRMGHFSYVGDATVGPNVNIGAGTVTCNYDGVTKHRTIIEEGALIGSDCMLVAPVRVGARAVTGAGSVVIRDVAPETVVVGVPARVTSRKKSPENDIKRPAPGDEPD